MSETSATTTDSGAFDSSSDADGLRADDNLPLPWNPSETVDISERSGRQSSSLI